MAEDVTHDANVSKVSIVGLGMATQTGVADRMFRALAERSINIQTITTSEIKISVLVQREQAHGRPCGPCTASSNSRSRPATRATFGEQARRGAGSQARSTSSPGCSGWKT